MRWNARVLLPLLLAFTGAARGALLVDGYDPLLHARFANSPSFIAAGFDLSGVARSSGNKWGTLVSRNAVISAYHWRPTAGQTLVFYATNNPLGPSQTRTVLTGQRVGTSDLWLAVLDNALPAEYTSLVVHNEPLANEAAFKASQIYNSALFMVGRSDNVDSSVTNHAVGRNRLDYWYQSVSDGGTTDLAIAAVKDLPGDANYLADEAYLQTYDSGAPLLAVISGQLRIIGLNWFILADQDVDPHPVKTRLRNVSGFSYAGNYAAPVQAFTNAFAIDITSGYVAWMGTAFPGVTDLVPKGSANDFDGDGLNNFLEYAFCLNPASGAEANPASAGVAQIAGAHHLQVTFKARQDAELQYFVRSGSDLAGWTETGLLFSGGAWSSAQPATATVAAATSLGGGIWQLTVRATSPLAPGQPRFLAPGAR